MNWRAPDREDRQVAMLWAVCAGLAIGLRPVWLAAVPFLPACPWHALTGWPCPGCGTTRAVVRLLHADWRGALAVNPLAASGAVTFLAGGLSAPVWFACGGKAPSQAMRPRTIWLALAGAIFLANWVWLVVAGI
jgi:Protein of unknown function (DUF2752)